MTRSGNSHGSAGRQQSSRWPDFYDTALKLGISTTTLTKAALGNVAAQDQVNAAVAAGKQTLADYDAALKASGVSLTSNQAAMDKGPHVRNQRL